VKTLDQRGRQVYLCWLCNKRLMYVAGRLCFVEFELPNGAKVKMHKVCEKDYRENPTTYPWEAR